MFFKNTRFIVSFAIKNMKKIQNKSNKFLQICSDQFNHLYFVNITRCGGTKTECPQTNIVI